MDVLIVDKPLASGRTPDHLDLKTLSLLFWVRVLIFREREGHFQEKARKSGHFEIGIGEDYKREAEPLNGAGNLFIFGTSRLF